MQRRNLTVYFFQLVALLAAAWFFRHALNPDAVAYLQNARHYADGEMTLAISGHWSPLISWIIAVFLKLGLPPLAAARLFMILSAMIFLVGCSRLFSAFKISEQLHTWGLWTVALLSVPWSVENITPDLLLGGLTSFAVAEMVVMRWCQKSGAAIFCGGLWGVAYLCKSVALPLGALTALGLGLWWWKSQRDQLPRIIKAFALTLLGMALVAAPWISVLTNHYGKLTIASSAGYNHALVGPGLTNRLFLLDQGLRVPPAGRVTIWEDPISPYPDWSPLASWSNAKWQLHIMLANAPVVVFLLASISLALPVLLATLVVRSFRGEQLAVESTALWALLPVIILAALFLPNHLLASEQRYFYCAAPLLFAAAGCRWFIGKRWQYAFASLLAASFLVPNLARAGLYLNSTRIAGECAVELAEKISSKQLAGSVAGSGKLPGGRTGLYVAWHLQQPWYGDEPSPAAADYKSSGAKLVIVNRGSGIASELAGDKTVRNLDEELFGSAESAATFPLQVFENLTPALTTNLK
jgi:hypothetical protein